MSGGHSERHPPVGVLGPLRFLFRLLALVLLLLLLLPFHYLWRLFGAISPWPQRFLVGAAWICNLRIAKEGIRLKENVFYVANHLSWLDILILGSATNTAYVAQDGIAKWPVVGWLAKLNHTIFVSRADRLGVAEQIAQLKEALHDHQPVTIFPEGTTTDGCSLRPFKPTLFAVLSPPPRPMQVQPVLLDFCGEGPEIAWIGEETVTRNAWRVLCRRKIIPVRVKFLDPFDPAQCNGRKEIAATAREQIRLALAASLGGRAVL
ncbi:MAG: lysophospholipid acyltransferase family protein [Parasphingopyxis sp.]